MAVRFDSPPSAERSGLPGRVVQMQLGKDCGHFVVLHVVRLVPGSFQHDIRYGPVRSIMLVLLQKSHVNVFQETNLSFPVR